MLANFPDNAAGPDGQYVIQETLAEALMETAQRTGAGLPEPPAPLALASD
jgi:hypothetical protein